MQTPADIPDIDAIQTLSMIQLYKLCKRFNVDVGKKDTDKLLREKLIKKKKTLQEQVKWLEETTKRFEQDRETVKEIYKRLHTFLESEVCKKWIKPEIDRRHGGNVINENAKKKDEINQKECPIVVTGETSAGKSSFLNMLFCFDTLPQSVMHCTNTICRIKNSTDKRLEVTDFDGNTKTEARNVSDEEFRKTIKTYTTVDAEEPKQYVKYVDIYWPIPFLLANITIVDTPGVSSNSELTKRLFDLLPQALAIIYILNTPNDGGVQTDRLGDVLKVQLDNKKLKNDLEFDSSTTMFICNKWDQIAAEESEDVYKSVITRLGSNWPNFREEQLYKLSVKNVSKGTGETYDLNRFKESFMHFLKSSLKQFLIVELRWCRRLLAEIMHISNSDHHTSGMENTSRREFLRQHTLQLDRIKIEAFKIKTDFELKLEVIQNQLAGHLYKHVQDQKVKDRILHKVEENCRNFHEGNLGEEKQNIIRRYIREELTLFCNNPGNNIQKCLENAHNEVAVHLDKIQKKIDVAYHILDGTLNSNLYLLEWFINQSILLHLSVMGSWTYRKTRHYLKVSLVTGIPSLLKKASEAVNTDHDKGSRKDDIFQSTMKFIDNLTEDGMKNFLKECYFKEIKRIFAQAFDDMLEQQVVNEKKYLSTLGNKTTSVVLYDYGKVQSQCQQISKSITEFLLQQVSKKIIPYDNVKFIEEMATGNFSTIHKIEEKINSGVRLSVIKEIKADDLYGYLEIYEKLRTLDNSHVLKIFGFTVKDDNKDEVNGIRACVIMEFCEAYLTSEWKNEMPCSEKKPDSTEFKASLLTYLQFSIQICEGLAFLHESGLEHKNLKLENILVAKNETKTIKIAFYEELQIAKDDSRDIMYVAPEMISRDMEKIVFQADDVYSLAIIMWEMWYHERAFDSVASQTNIREFLKKGGRPSFSSEISEEIKETIKTCWDQTPMKRPSCKETAEKITVFRVRHSQRM